MSCEWSEAFLWKKGASNVIDGFWHRLKWILGRKAVLRSLLLVLRGLWWADTLGKIRGVSQYMAQKSYFRCQLRSGHISTRSKRSIEQVSAHQRATFWLHFLFCRCRNSAIDSIRFRPWSGWELNSNHLRRNHAAWSFHITWSTVIDTVEWCISCPLFEKSTYSIHKIQNRTNDRGLRKLGSRSFLWNLRSNANLSSSLALLAEAAPWSQSDRRDGHKYYVYWASIAAFGQICSRAVYTILNMCRPSKSIVCTHAPTCGQEEFTDTSKRIWDRLYNRRRCKKLDRRRSLGQRRCQNPFNPISQALSCRLPNVIDEPDPGMWLKSCQSGFHGAFRKVSQTIRKI
jgi:hypothetical protein